MNHKSFGTALPMSVRSPGQSRFRLVLLWDVLVPTAIFAVFWTVWMRPAGLHYSLIPIDFWQLLPVEPLRDHPWRSLLYLHAQPPALNLILAAILKLDAWTPLNAQAWATLTMTTLGWLTCVGWYAVARRLLGAAWPAALIVILLAINPGFAFFLIHLFYPTLLLVEVALLVLGVRHFARRPTMPRLLGVMAFYALMVYTRTLWHPLFGGILAGLAGWHLWRRTGNRRVAARQALAALGFFAALVAPWMVKNKILFNEAGFTTWLGVNVRNLGLGPNALWHFVSTGQYDQSTVRKYYSKRQWQRLQNEPAATLLWKTLPPGSPAPPSVNMNHLAVPALNRLALRQTLEGYRRRPGELFTNLAFNVFYVSLPAAYGMYSYDNQTMHYGLYYETPYARWHDRLYYGGWLIPRTRIKLGWGYVGLNVYLVFWLPLALIGGILRLRTIARPEGLTWALLLALYVWLLTVVVIIDGSEGARMRWHLEPVFLLLTFQTLRELTGVARRRLRRQASPDLARASSNTGQPSM